MKNFKVFDFADRETEINTLGFEVDYITVIILSGDETGIVTFKDGTQLRFDALRDAEEFRGVRFHSFYDGCYIVHNNQLEEWQKCGEEKVRGMSYKRQEMFKPTRWGIKEED